MGKPFLNEFENWTWNRPQLSKECSIHFHLIQDVYKNPQKVKAWFWDVSLFLWFFFKISSWTLAFSHVPLLISSELVFGGSRNTVYFKNLQERSQGRQLQCVKRPGNWASSPHSNPRGLSVQILTENICAVGKRPILLNTGVICVLSKSQKSIVPEEPFNPLYWHIFIFEEEISTYCFYQYGSPNNNSDSIVWSLINFILDAPSPICDGFVSWQIQIVKIYIHQKIPLE